MNSAPKVLLGRVLSATGLELFPVRVKAGYTAGARWTLHPWSSYWRGLHEPALQQVLESFGDIRGWSCWDLGAHFGYYSVGLAMRVGSGGEVAAFEPNPVSYARLDRHRRMNGLTWLKTFPLAVSDSTGTAELKTYGDIHSTSTHLAYEGENPSDLAAPVSVTIATLDSLVAQGRIRPPDFIKVDVEGHGHRALSGARASISARRPILVVAFHSLPEIEGVFGVLRPLGYTWHRVGAPAGTPANEPPGEGMITHDYFFAPGAKK